MLIEGIRIFYPQAYALIRDNGQFFHGAIDRYGDGDKAKELIKVLLDSAVDSFGARERESITGLLRTLFPKLSGLLGGASYGSGWYNTWAKEQRVCSPDYFARYFTYAVPTGDVSDATILAFLEDLESKTPEDVSSQLGEILDKRNAEKVVQKLREREKTLTPNDSVVLSKAIALLGASFPNPDQMFSFRNAWSQAAILVHQLLLNISDQNQRVTLATEIIRDATPISFCLECFRWMSSSDMTPEEERTFDKTIEAELGKTAAGRIREEAKGKNLYIEYGVDARLLVWSWAHWGNKEESVAYLAGFLDVDNMNVIRFLESYLPTAWGLETGISHKGNLMRNQYESIMELVDSALIMDKLVALFGPVLRDAKPERCEYAEYPADKKVAYQFAGLHNYVQKELADSKQSHPTYPGGRADAHSGSAEA